MGRRPNAVVLQYFERGQKLADNSNRYSHTCKLCGEVFPKGRIDSLTNHLTKKCVAISEADRINACLALNGISHASHRNKNHVQPNGPPVDLPLIQQQQQQQQQRDWTALETLAEVSRQAFNDEKHDDNGQVVNGVPQTPPPAGAGPHTSERFELQEQYTLDNPPSAYSNGVPQEKRTPQKSSPPPENVLSAEEQLQALVQSTTSATEQPNLSVAAAATARLNPSLLDPQLLGEDLARALEQPLLQAPPLPAEATPAAINNPAQPWGEITYMTQTLQPVTLPNDVATSATVLNKGGFRLDSPNGAKARHSRARFDATRRKEVQEVRKLGACIRCRILRKNCSVGHPCDTCRKVLSPRIWRSGCVRTKFTEQLDIYSAGVQIVLAQHRINNFKATLNLVNNGVVIEAYLFPETEKCVRAEVVQGTGLKNPDADPLGADVNNWANMPVVMLDNDKEDVPAKLEAFMKDMLHEFVHRETSHFMRVTLESALEIVQESNDELLKKALELWGLVEVLDRERAWNILVKPTAVDEEPMWIKEDTDQETYTTICLQLTAAAERKAAATSKSLLTGMQRVLQDSKTKVDFSMFFTTMILLNCVEKTTWAFKAWEQDSLRAMWPLEKPPSSFTQQGYVVADLLRMLLGIRKALPRTACRESDGILITEEQDPVMQSYFQSMNLSMAEVQNKQQNPAFSPTDSRSFDLLFCSTLLLPEQPA